jgi:predicted phosphatase
MTLCYTKHPKILFITDLDKTVWDFTVEDRKFEQKSLYPWVLPTLANLQKNKAIICCASKGHYSDESVFYMKQFKIYDFFNQVHIIPSDNKPFPFNSIGKFKHFDYINALTTFQDYSTIFLDDNEKILRDIKNKYPKIECVLVN